MLHGKLFWETEVFLGNYSLLWKTVVSLGEKLNP